MATSTMNPVYKVDANGNVIGTGNYEPAPSQDSQPPLYATAVQVHAVPTSSGLIPPPGHHVIAIPGPGVDSVYNLSDTEVILLAYQTPVKYLAIIDFIFSLIFLGVIKNWVLAMISVFGPIFGIWGASSLAKNPTVVYFIFCIYGCVADIFVMSVEPNFLTVLSFFVQLYITKIVGSFTRALQSLSEERLNQIRKPDFASRATYGGRQVRAYYY